MPRASWRKSACPEGHRRACPAAVNGSRAGFFDEEAEGEKRMASTENALRIGGREVFLFGDTDARIGCIQTVDTHDLSAMEEELAALREAAGDIPVLLAAVQVHDWNAELTPWTAPPVYGKTPFGDGAAATLAELTGLILPGLTARFGEKRWLIAGYSLAGLFALWSVYQTDAFAGAAAVSPSVWYPGWLDYAEAHTPAGVPIYLSLGDREEKTKHPVMREVGNAIRHQEELLKAQSIPTTLEWNPGNHFMDSGSRTAKGIAWLVRKLTNDLK